MLTHLRHTGLWLVLLGLNLGTVQAQQEATPKQAAKKSQPPASTPAKTHVVSESPFKIEVTLQGIFEAERMFEVVLRPEVWSNLVVVKAVELGQHVNKGQTLVELDRRKIDEELNSLKYSRQLSRLARMRAESELLQLTNSLPFDLKAAERSRQNAVDDLDFFLSVDRELRIKSAKESLKRSEYSLENAQEELKQLEQMYKADDLTEETEEIILKRARRSVESSRHFLESNRIRTDRTLNATLPREEEQLKESARKQKLALEKAKSSLPRQIQQKEIELEKLTYTLQQSDERFEKLKQDRQDLIVKSPQSGIVYYGNCVRGKWAAGSTLAKQLRRGGSLSANQVFMTIVQPRPLFVRADLPENDLEHMRQGIEGKVVPKAYSNLKLPATVESISQIPVTAGTFDTHIRIELANAATTRIMPGMACTVKLVVYQKEDALTVPASAVFSEELDEDAKFVYVASEGAAHEKRRVVVGKQSGKKSEILEGLQPGDKILLAKPE